MLANLYLIRHHLLHRAREVIVLLCENEGLISLDGYQETYEL